MGGKGKQNSYYSYYSYYYAPSKSKWNSGKKGRNSYYYSSYSSYYSSYYYSPKKNSKWKSGGKWPKKGNKGWYSNYYSSYYSSYYYKRPGIGRYNIRHGRNAGIGAVGISVIVFSCLLGVAGTGLMFWCWRQKKFRTRKD